MPSRRSGVRAPSWAEAAGGPTGRTPGGNAAGSADATSDGLVISSAPIAGPAASSSHSAPWNSSENRAGSAISLTSSHTRDGGASTCTSTSTDGPSA